MNKGQCASQRLMPMAPVFKAYVSVSQLCQVQWRGSKLVARVRQDEIKQPAELQKDRFQSGALPTTYKMLRVSEMQYSF